MKRSKHFRQGYGDGLLVPPFDAQQPRAIDEESPGLRHVGTLEADDERQCSHCGSWAVQSLGVIYASSSQTLATLSPYRVATPSLATWVTRAYPPEKMTSWNGFTLTLLLWPPCLFLLGTVFYAWLTGGVARESALLYATAAAIGIAAWAIPAFLRKREATEHNMKIWEPAMRKWRTTYMCLKCGRI
jgi:hypothetical protein